MRSTAMLRHELSRFRRGLLVAVFDTPDRVQHMFWRFRDPQHPLYDPALAKRYERVIPELYESMDRILGEVLASAGDQTAVLVASDHGFSEFRTAVHLNAWLRDHGWLVMAPDASLENTHQSFEGVDWPKTKAYAIGLAGVYLNRAGREGQGIVTPEEAGGLLDRLAGELGRLTDPATGRPVIRRIYRREELYAGPYADQAPDLVLGFEAGYRASWDTVLGDVPPQVFVPNTKRWSGDHGIDPPLVPGVLLVNRPIASQQPRIIDLAPTILSLFGLEPPAEMDGQALQ